MASRTKTASKTTVKPKAAPATKSTSSKASKGKQAKPAHPASTEIRMIPLSQLALSPKNVRKVAPSEADDAELLASIHEKGIIQNLAGYEDGKGGYLIDAGGRRLKALKQLASDGVIGKDHLIPCLIEDEAEATLTSTTENMARAAMHPADEFDAFAKMIDEGRAVGSITRKFGVSEVVVRRRL